MFDAVVECYALLGVFAICALSCFMGLTSIVLEYFSVSRPKLYQGSNRIYVMRLNAWGGPMNLCSLTSMANKKRLPCLLWQFITIQYPTMMYTKGAES